MPCQKLEQQILTPRSTTRNWRRTTFHRVAVARTRRRFPGAAAKDRDKSASNCHTDGHSTRPAYFPWAPKCHTEQRLPSGPVPSGQCPSPHSRHLYAAIPSPLSRGPPAAAVASPWVQPGAVFVAVALTRSADPSAAWDTPARQTRDAAAAAPPPLTPCGRAATTGNYSTVAQLV